MYNKDAKVIFFLIDFYSIILKQSGSRQLKTETCIGKPVASVQLVYA